MITSICLALLSVHATEPVSLSTKDAGTQRVAEAISAVITRSKKSAIMSELESYERTGMLQPGARRFISSVDGLSRSIFFEHLNGKERVSCYRIDNGTTLIKVDGRGMTIDHRGDGAKWYNIGFPITEFSAPLYFEKRMEIADRFHWIVQEMLSPSGIHYEGVTRGDAWVTFDDDGKNTTVKIYMRGSSHNPELSVTALTDHGLHLLEWIHREGAQDPEKWIHREVIRNEFKEERPGVVMLKKGALEISSSGTANPTGGSLTKVSIEFTSTTFGAEFTIPMRLKDLPIDAGTVVEDYRFNPPISR
ncbi:MAG: hypothetical protein WDZ51_11405 [Pirellulaceae bacterium]